MDNSPLWDDALARMTLGPEEIPSYQRVDVDVAEVAERPTDAEYDRYAYLVRLFRDLRYHSAEIRDASPFAIQPVLFNSLLVQANRDLAQIAGVVGSDPEPYETWAEDTAAALDAKLWDEGEAMYFDYDVRGGHSVATQSPTGFAPLYAGVPDRERAERMVERLAAFRVQVAPGEDGWAVTSFSPDDPRFQPTLYWRGPVWPILNWVLYRGLIRYGFPGPAEQLRAGMIELVRRSGFWEHYNPTTGRGHGGEQFAWTAALVLDLLHERPAQKGELMTTADVPDSTTERRT
jgi:glycogen debranching enzyme